MSHFGVILSGAAYISHPNRRGLPSAKFLVQELGSWDGVAIWAGLRPHRDLREVIWKEARNLIIELAHNYHNGDFGPNPVEYECQRGSVLPGIEMLLRRFTTWENVLSWAGGFVPGSEEYYVRRHASRERQRRRERARKAELRQKMAMIEKRAEEGSGDGIPVTGTPQPRVYYDWATRSLRECHATSVR